ncbi:MAG: Fic family protein [Candidatus Nanoarchaeia archaeon]|nr:Fic family protein [Candidatus Nanoarchaeia archaeon]MDD5587877.1 Fic family protein [Candidatus Nanoarchaeia archaeon]
MLRKEDVIEINKQFDKGIVVNKTSLEYTISTLKNTKSWLRQAACLTRAILIDHIFEEGNKRTAAALILTYFEANKFAYDAYKLDKIIEKIVKKNITSIKEIEVLIKSVTR